MKLLTCSGDVNVIQICQYVRVRRPFLHIYKWFHLSKLGVLHCSASHAIKHRKTRLCCCQEESWNAKCLIPKQLFLFQKIIGVYSITIIRVCETTKIERKRSLGRLGVDGKIILKLVLMKQEGKAWTWFLCLGIGTSDGRL